ncbi:MAG: hypothetical protein KatS3mg057_2665 [Herpetosiphonaceae bacterium]|nr:MAG: hypothetical protein KatS3mg057_2665 [Herpetosiphonaceae bacterium]
MDYVTGAALVIRADVLNQIGLFDELYNPAYMEEVDLCLRVRRAGYRIVVNPDACLIHYEGTATTEHVQRLHWFNRGRLLFLIKTRPLSQLLTEFATAERAYFKTTRDFTNMRAIKRAYLDAILRLDAWCAAREVYQGQPVLQDDREQLMDLLVSLRNDCIRADCEKIDQRFQ